MSQARPKNVSDDLLSMPNDKWEQIINNYIKNEFDRIITKMYYLDGIPQCDIAEEFNYSRSTIRDRLYKNLKIIEKNAKK